VARTGDPPIVVARRRVEAATTPVMLLPQDRPFVEPPRLVLAEMPDCRVRTFCRADIPAVQRALCDAHVWRSYTPEDGSPVLPGIAVENYLVWLHQPGFHSFAACTPDTDEVFGCIHADCGQGVMSRSAELSGWMARSHWRSSVARRVNCAFVDWLFRERGVLRVFAQTYHPNRAAIGSLMAAGFFLEARLRHMAVKDGHLMDRLVFARLNPVTASMPRAPERDPSWLQRHRSDRVNTVAQVPPAATTDTPRAGNCKVTSSPTRQRRAASVQTTKIEPNSVSTVSS
jgi:RimJ/RimL family protein N-acetyltransferase